MLPQEETLTNFIHTGLLYQFNTVLSKGPVRVTLTGSVLLQEETLLYLYRTALSAENCSSESRPFIGSVFTGGKLN